MERASTALFGDTKGRAEQKRTLLDMTLADEERSGAPIRRSTHVCSRGEHSVQAECHFPARGSPTRTLRALVDRPGARGAVRRSSARAMNTTRCRLRCGVPAVHLRVSGAVVACTNPTGKHGGSPPPARSGHVPGVLGVVLARFTSPCAERTATSARAGDQSAVHLRLRGAEADAGVEDADDVGSPPPARSGLPEKAGDGPERRFTSAWAEVNRRSRIPLTTHAGPLRARGGAPAAHRPGRPRRRSPRVRRGSPPSPAGGWPRRVVPAHA